MAYFKINNVDFSMYVNKLKVGTKHKYKARENSNGDLRVQKKNTKYVVEVGIIPLDATSTKALLDEVNKFQVSITFMNPDTNALETINCYIPEHAQDYYTIQSGKTLLNAYSLTFTQL